MKTRVLVVFVIVAFCCFATPSWAGKGDKRVHFGLLNAMPTDDAGTDELDTALGFQVGVEFMVKDNFGIEPSLSVVNHDIEAPPLDDFGEIEFRALTANLNFHVLDDKKVDLYLGPTFGYVFWGDAETILGDFDADEEFTFGGNLGIDVPFGDGRWSFSAGLTYLLSEVSLDGAASDLGVDPMHMQVGVSYSF